MEEEKNKIITPLIADIWNIFSTINPWEDMRN